MVKVGFLGPKGTFSQQALVAFMGNNNFEGVEFTSIPSILQAVAQNTVGEAIVPMENSIEGGINATIDMLSAESCLYIKNEFILHVEQNLLSLAGTSINNITRVLSHPQPIGQCSKYINNILGNAVISFTSSTAAAAAEVRSGVNGLAAIGPKLAGDIYGLEILASGIQDDDNNFTRFVIVSKSDSPRTGKDKTSIVFSTDDKPGSLYRVLDILNLWDINMMRIESRPAKNMLGRYIFFVDIEGHRQDPDVRDALSMIERKSSYFRILGSYPAHKV